MKSQSRKALLWIAGLTMLSLLAIVILRRPAASVRAADQSASTIRVQVDPQGPLVLTTKTAEFRVLASGYIQASLIDSGRPLSLDDPSKADGTGDYIISQGNSVRFSLDFTDAKVSEASGKMGAGKRVEIPGNARDSSGTKIQQILTVEVYDEFPSLLLSSSEYRNSGNNDLHIDQLVSQRHRFNAHLTDAHAAPYEMWSFQGSSYDWGKDDIQKLKAPFSQPNLMGAVVKGGYGGGIPVVAFWTRNVGEAIGHVETVPLTVSLPVRVGADRHVTASLDFPGPMTLKPGGSYSTPRSFVAVYSGDYYQPLHLWSRVLQKEGWELPKPSNEAYNASWCGWGYEFNVTAAQMLGTIPKLKEMGIKWATLDDRWFNNYGDWQPRKETFPGDSMQQMVRDFHKQGMLVQLWWLPLGVEDGQGRWESHKYLVSDVVREHPDWLILDKNGRHGRITRDLAALCPAVPEVQDYYKKLTERFIRDWDFDGSKLDNIYTVPECHNPAHHHKSPQDSVNAMADVYRVIYQTTRALKPESVTQSCPCGTPPSLAWLPYMDQAVTADPVGAVQVRRRIKMYKALLGPEAAVYGDHVELSAMTRAGKDWIEHGDDFASTIGAGGVVGTKFVWPDPGPKFKRVNLTKEKEAHWKKWIAVYNDKMLSKGNFLPLYVYGYDAPEAYAIEKDGRMYYAFFAASTNSAWHGEVELRGLTPGTYNVLDYADNKSLGTVTVSEGTNPRIKTEFKEHLLLEVTRK
ncbi:MAG TPA: alpha-galactosidase [Terriglobales bacterium]|nr:alpha-galactosidase [Terriglobales bacterium]